MGNSVSSLSAAAYGTSALLYFGLGAMLWVSWRGRLQGGLLLAAVGATLAWCLVLVSISLFAAPGMHVAIMFEAVRNAAWFVFLLRLFMLATGASGGSSVVAGFATVCGVLVVGQFALPAASLLLGDGAPPWAARGVVLVGLLSAVVGLALVEQLVRNLDSEARWALKFLCLGTGGVFAFDLYLYSDSLLFSRFDGPLIAARGVIQGMVVPLLALAAVRNPQWAVPVFVSRQVVFHSATLLGAGLYLVVMSAAGFWLRAYGGTWGSVAQVAFLFGAVVLLLVLMTSGQLRARARVLIAKHFYRNRYDYRQEWLRFSANLSGVSSGEDLPEALVRAVAAIVESPAGALWVRRPGGPVFRRETDWNCAVGDTLEELPAEVVDFLRGHGWVIYMDEWRALRAETQVPSSTVRRSLRALPLESIEAELPDAWVLVPLAHGEEMLGVIALTRSGGRTDLNWEDGDLLKTVGKQAGGHLALWFTSDALAQARQFEAFNRLAAFVVHDLKNLSAQLALIESNAAQFRDEPEFVDDTFATVARANAKLRRMLHQLRGATPGVAAGPVQGGNLPLGPVLESVVEARAKSTPAPRLLHCPEDAAVRCDREALEAVLLHLLQNAQDATPAEGKVTLAARIDGDNATIVIRDTGEGMDDAFVRDRLFRPFDTTKGNAGMGVGVYQSRDFAVRNDGALDVSSTPGEGTEFRLRLPLAAAASNEGARTRLEELV